MYSLQVQYVQLFIMRVFLSSMAIESCFTIKIALSRQYFSGKGEYSFRLVQQLAYAGDEDNNLGLVTIFS